ncbi:MAG: hypothetical protein MK179_22215, partial [Pirellulaceae bacterium]|nr:hypothetical protein [Pirellulaceae bacterium]
AKVKTNFIYDWRASHLLPVLFNGQGTNSPTPLFHQVVETNRQSLNLGPALVRLVSTDVRFIDGRHLDGGVVTYNELPHYIDVPSDPPVFLSTWDNAADPYLMDVFATNPGSKNDGLEGDVIVGYFKPLHPCFTNAGHADDVYFMVLNGLSDPNGTPSETSQQIHLGFDFGTSGISSLQRMSRDTGLVEIVNLDHDGGSQYHLDLTIEGGTADLFKFNNGGEFVANNITVSPEFTWTADGVGDWMLPDSWGRECDAPPNNSMHTAVFGDSPSITRSTVAVVTSPVTVNRIEFDNPSDSYAIVGLHHVRLLANADTLELPAIDVLNGTHEFQASVELVNSTTVNVASNATLFFNNSVNLLGSVLTKTGLGEIVFGNALLTSGGTFNCNEGSCSGSAAISGDVNNNGGTVSPGSSPGVLPVDGNYSQSEAGTLLIELAGTEAGTMHDVLKVAGLASLGGKLDVVLLDAFQPYVGDRFDILDFSSLTGEFTQLSFPDLPSGFAWDDSELYSTGTISVSFVPEPGCHALLILCGFVIMFLRVQKRSYSN